MIDREILARLARETGTHLAELGVRPEDRSWIEKHAESVTSLGRTSPAWGSLRRGVYRLARRAARIAR
jgi:hypothetical protein